MSNKAEMKEKLLNQLTHTPLTRQQMADYLGVSVIFIARYITELRASKQIYIARYERTPNGKPKSFYATGNRPDVEELAPVPQHVLRQRYKEKRKELAKPKKAQITMDLAASWMKNPC